MQVSSHPLHTLNTLPAAEAAELAASTPPATRLAFGPHARLFPDPAMDPLLLTQPFRFGDLPVRLEGGVDVRWRRRSHRARSIFRGWRADRADRRRRPSTMPRKVSSTVFVDVRVGGAMRALVWTVAVEIALAVLMVAGVLLRGRHA